MSTGIRAAIVAAVITGVLAGGGALYVRGDYSAAQKLLSHGQYREAKKRLHRYLRLYRSDYRARMVLAEAIIADDNRLAVEAARDALRELEKVPDNSPQGAEARTREGRLLFLILLRPSEAEPKFRKAIELSPRAIDPRVMLWNLLNVTGRKHFTRDLFWSFYELTPQADRPYQLRSWYMVEFGRNSAFAEFDRKIGTLGKDESPSVTSEFERLKAISAAEPHWSIGMAALARLLRSEGQRDLADEIMQKYAPPDAMQDPFFLATKIELAMDVGRFDEARNFFNQWPEPQTGFEYWMWRGIVADEVDRNDEEAIASYQQAILEETGDFDWQLMNRLAHCLLRAGRVEEARKCRERANRIEKLMELKFHKKLRLEFAQLDNPQSIREIIGFYGILGRKREVDEWTAWLEQITGNPGNSHSIPSDDGNSPRK